MNAGRYPYRRSNSSTRLRPIASSTSQMKVTRQEGCCANAFASAQPRPATPQTMTLRRSFPAAAGSPANAGRLPMRKVRASQFDRDLPGRCRGARTANRCLPEWSGREHRNTARGSRHKPSSCDQPCFLHRISSLRGVRTFKPLSFDQRLSIPFWTTSVPFWIAIGRVWLAITVSATVCRRPEKKKPAAALSWT